MSRLEKCLIVCLTLLAVGVARADGLQQAQVSLFKAQLSLAQSGDPDGEYYVGEMYEKGLGTPQNLNLAREWYEKSAKQGNVKAKAKLVALGMAMKQAQEEKKEMAAEAAQRQKDLAAQAAAKAEEVAAERAKEAAEAARRQKELAAAAKVKAKAAAQAREEAKRARAKEVASQEAETAEAAKQKSAGQRHPMVQKTVMTSTSVPKADKVTATLTKPASQKGTASPPQFSANPCRGPTAKFLSTCQ